MYIDVNENAVLSFKLASDISNKMLLIRHYINTEIDIEMFTFDDTYINVFMKWLSEDNGMDIDLKIKALEITVDRVKTKIDSYGNYMEHQKQLKHDKQNKIIINDIKYLRDFIQNFLTNPESIVDEARKNVEKINSIANKSFMEKGVKSNKKLKVNVG